MPNEYLFLQGEVNRMDWTLTLMPRSEPMELADHCDEIMVRRYSDHKISACPYNQPKLLKSFDEALLHNQNQVQLSTDLKGGSRTIQKQYGSHLVRLHTTSKKLICFAVLASAIVPVTSAASPTYSSYLDATTLALLTQQQDRHLRAGMRGRARHAAHGQGPQGAKGPVLEARGCGVDRFGARCQEFAREGWAGGVECRQPDPFVCHLVRGWVLGHVAEDGFCCRHGRNCAGGR